MGSSYWYDTINLGCSTVSRGVRLYIFKKYFFYLNNSVDPDEMPHYVAFHLGLHCL